MFGGILQDLRYGARMLLKSPTYTAIAIAALALSIGANTAVFSAVNTLLLRPLPLKDLDRLVFSVALREGFDLPEAAEIWLPLQTKIDSLPLTDRAVPGYEVVAKLRPGVSLKEADAESKSIARQLEQEFPQIRRGWSVKLIWLRQELLGDLAGRVNKALVALIGGVGFLLLICCANVANLQLARGFARTRELALRRALGASRARVIRRLLTESMLLALLGGAAGLVLAHWIVPLLAAINPIQGISLAGFFHSFRIDSRVLIFALLMTLATGVIFGLLPALKGAGEREVMPSLKQGDQHSASAPGHGWLNVLIVSEIAIAMTLLVAGGLIARSFNRLQHVDLGFKSDNLLTVKMILPASKYSEYRQRIAFVDQVLERVKILPGVLSAGTTTNIPLEREIAYDSVFSVEGRPPVNPNDVPITSHRLVSPDYLKTLAVTLIKGRLIDESDRAGKSPVVVVSEELARQAWPGEDPLGKRIKRVRPNQDFPWMTVIGVVKDVKE